MKRVGKFIVYWNQAQKNFAHPYTEDWSFTESDLDLNQMAEKFTETMDEALDEIAPLKSFTIRTQHKFGLSDRTKKLMEDRNKTRMKIAIGNSSSQKKIIMQKYKTLRNQVNSSLRKDSVDFNNNRVEQAKDENEIWNVVIDVLQPRK